MAASEQQSYDNKQSKYQFHLNYVCMREKPSWNKGENVTTEFQSVRVTEEQQRRRA